MSRMTEPIPVSESRELMRIVSSLVLSRRFHLSILGCDVPRVAFRVPEALVAAAVEDGGPQRELRLLNPYETDGGQVASVDFDALVDRVLRPMLRPWEGGGVLHVLDGTLAVPEDDEAWTRLFQRMNEVRNRMVGALDAATLFLLPARSVVALAESAPDLWSIRSTAGTLDCVTWLAMEDRPNPWREDWLLSRTVPQRTVTEMRDLLRDRQEGG